MSIVSFNFILFLALLFITYYSVPKRIQWIVLLIASLFFYSFCGIKSFIFMLTTATTVYGASLWIYKISNLKKEYIKTYKKILSKDELKKKKKQFDKKQKCILTFTLIINFLFLCIFKYFHFAYGSLATLFKSFGIILPTDTLNLIAPLGISFYTFQATGYLIDVYWDNVKPLKNYFKTLLFVSFFPQITQGPISDFEQLSGELFKNHKCSYDNFSFGFQRMLWGFMKKMVIADMLYPYVSDIFNNYNKYAGIAVLLGAFGYSIQIYADFSGYMDIMCGFCQMLDIKLSENFERPYFSKSIAEYWRRWHITLGVWFKKYIYYPIAMAKWNQKLGKKGSKTFGKFFGKTMPATIALIVVWFVTGLWHGASWAYIAWGGVNGIFLIVSLWLEPVYKKIKTTLKIREEAQWWRAFQVLRTFFLVTLIKVLPEVGTLTQGLGLWKRIFTNFQTPSNLSGLIPYIDSIVSPVDFVVVIGFIFLIFAVSLIQRKNNVRALFSKCPLILRVLFLAVLCVVIFAFGITASTTGGFLYAQF